MNLHNKTISFLGDSITDFNYYISEIVKSLQPRQWFNYGMWGTRIAPQLQPTINRPYKDYDFISRIKDINSKSDVVFVFGGTNDYDHGDVPLGKLGDKTVKTFYGALWTLIKKINTQCNNPIIIFITPMQHVNENNRLGDGTKTVPSGTLNDYVIAIIETASKNQCHCVNLYRNKLLNPNIAAYGKKYFYEDLEHPTAAGHKLIAQDIIDNVLKIKE